MKKDLRSYLRLAALLPLFATALPQSVDPHQEIIPRLLKALEQTAPDSLSGLHIPNHVRIVGTDGSDELYGSEGRDFMSGNGGDDTFYANAGDDILLGRGGDDILYGEKGDDIIIPGGGVNRVFGGTGFDTVIFPHDAMAEISLVNRGRYWLIEKGDRQYRLFDCERLQFREESHLLNE